jgi:hypothetical protein
MTLSDAGTTASGYSDSTGGTRRRAKDLFKIGKRSKKDRNGDQVAHEISSPRNVKVCFRMIETLIHPRDISAL